MDHSLWVWGLFNLFILCLLAFDLGLLHRKQHTVHLKEALCLSAFYMTLGLLFAWGVHIFLGAEDSIEFLTGYLIEKSLSIDNIFVFVLIFTHFQVPSKYQHRVLFWGVLGAIVLRAILILSGAALLEEFHWIIYVFGAFLIITGFKMLWASSIEPDLKNNRVVLWVHKRLPVTEKYHEDHFWIREKGVFMFTPLFVVLILIEISDVIFAVDSIPAIFAISKDPFIVYTSNIFAILGLRALYFALADIIHRFVYLKYALSIILVFIGLKMIINGMFEGYIPTSYALIFTTSILFLSIVFSWIRSSPNAKPIKTNFTGWVPGSPPKKPKKKK